MTISSILTIRGRVSVASPDSPIAVLKDPLTNKLDAFFGGTITGKQHIESNKDLLVGVFDNTMNVQGVHLKLLSATQSMS